MSRSGLVWVTGAHGLLGGALVAALGRYGHEVLATGREVDVSERDALVAALGDRPLRCVFNAAAFTAVDEAETHPEAAFAVNAVGAGHVAELARARGADLVHFSTDYVFDGASRRPLREDDPTAPLNVYGRSKLAGEGRVLATLGAGHGALATRDPDRRVLVIRTSWLFGPHGPSFVSRMLELLAEREELFVVADQRGRPTSSLDLADAALELAGLGRPTRATPSGTYHFANAGVASWHELAVEVRDVALRHGLPLRTLRIHAVTSADVPRPATRPRWSVLATDRIERALGRPPRPWREALEEYLASV